MRDDREWGRRLDRWLLPVAALISLGMLIPGLVIGAAWYDHYPPEELLVVLVALTFLTGARLDGAASVAGLILLSFGTSDGDLGGSVVSMWVFTVPAWIVGRVMRSRSRLSAQLAERARELEREREAFARESVRLERARIARDLHDIVAHSLSMIVVQAGAGRRAAASDPAIAAESLRHIERGAHQAEREIDQIVRLLARTGPGPDAAGLEQLDELIGHAAAGGLSITYALSGITERVPAALGGVVYRVAQEGITNALKHAPGAAIAVAVDARGSAISVSVQNGPAARSGARLERAGGGFGLAGAGDRVRAAGGTFTAGPIPGGGWRLAAELPGGASG